MTRKYPVLHLIGPPGSGKGTQGRVLARIPGFFYFSSGDLLRSLDPNHESVRLAHEAMQRGDLVPDELIVSLWREHVQDQAAAGAYQPERDVQILDGLPRTVRQAEMLDDSVDVVKILNLVCRDEEALIDRLKLRALERSQRPDDVDENVIRHRLKVYQEETDPVLGYYPDDLIAEIDALRSPLEVLHSVLEVLIPLQDKFSIAKGSP